MTKADKHELAGLIQADDWPELAKRLDDGVAVDTVVSLDEQSFPASLLQLASSFGAVKVVRGLLARGADREFGAHYGTALHCAVEYGQYEAAKILLENGANPNALGPALVEGDDRWTPLMYAAYKNHRELAELLLDHQADAGLTSARGVGAITAAVASKNEEIVEKLMKLVVAVPTSALFCVIEQSDDALMRRLFEKKCELNRVATSAELANVKKGMSLLGFALERRALALQMAEIKRAMGQDAQEGERLLAMIRILLAAGADANEKVENRTLLSLAVFQNDLEVVKGLLSAGADVSGECFFVEGGKGTAKKILFHETALHTAVRHASFEVIAELLKAGADADAVDKDGISVRELSKRDGGAELARLIGGRGRENAKG